MMGTLRFYARIRYNLDTPLEAKHRLLLFDYGETKPRVLSCIRVR